MGEHSTDVGEGNIAHGVVTRVAVCRGASTRWTASVVAAARAEHGVGRVSEVHVTELVSVIGAASGRTIVREGHSLPFATVQTGDVDVRRGVAQGSELGTSAVEGDTLAGCHEDLNTGLDGQVRGNDEVVVGWVDADRAVNQIPNGVGGDVSRHVGTLAFVGHHAVVHGTVLVGVDITVVVVVTCPERCDGTGPCEAASAVGQSRLVVGPEVSLDVGVAVGDEVHRTATTDLDTVVAVIAVVGGAEVFEFKVGREVNVCVAVVLVRVPVVGRDAVVEVGVSVGGSRHGRVGIRYFCQALVEGFPSVV